MRLKDFSRATRVAVVVLGSALYGLTDFTVPASGQQATRYSSVSLSPQDTYLSIDHTTYSREPTLRTYTWPDHRAANAVLMKFDLSGLPPGAVVQEATLDLTLVESDASPDTAYTVSAHKVLGKRVDVRAATGYTADGTTRWTGAACCAGGAPLAQGDISPVYDARLIDKTPGVKSWTLTAMVQEWQAAPATNFGLVLNADGSRSADRYRIFASTEYPDAALRPVLRVAYAMPPQQETFAAQDTYLNVNAKNYSSSASISTYTWPDRRAANAILVKFDVSSLPAGAVVHDATLQMALIDSDKTADNAYTITAHKVVGKNPTIAKATGYTIDGAAAWTANACCYNNVPLAQADISPAYDTRAVDKTRGYKIWTLTRMVQEWVADPATNFGALLNPDTAAARDRYRTFASAEAADSALRPVLRVSYSVPSTSEVLAPQQDTFLNLDATNYGTQTQLHTYTWPDRQVANAVLLQFDVSGLPAGAVVEEALLHLALVASDGRPEPTYTVTAHKVVGRNPVLSAATGYTADGVTPWTANACCHKGVPLAQADVSAAYDARAIDKVRGYKVWTLTRMVQEWLDAPATNFGLLLNSDGSKLRDRYRFFASVDAPDASLRPFLRVTYSVPTSTPDTTPPSVSVTSPAEGTLVTGSTTFAATATDAGGVAGVQFQIDGSPIGSELAAAPYELSWDTTPLADGDHTVTATARDQAGNVATSSPVRVRRDRAPVVSSVAAASVTTSGATINWTTNEPADSQVEYGATTAYGSVTAVNPALVTSHTVTLSGLAEATRYHFRVRSRDAGGNMVTSPDATFTTADATPPTVSIAAPGPGTTVSGTITVSATAADNLSVAGVQFKLDGANLGAEDTTSPYSVVWTTTAASNGSHTLTALARDGSGNQASSPAVLVTVSNGTTPPPATIASLYPGDVGIENHPDVVFVERFDESSLNTVLARWTDVLNGSAMALTPDVPAGSPGSRSLNIPWQGGGASDGGHLYQQLSPGFSDTLYVRYYIKYPTSGRYQHTGVWIGGSNPPLAWPNPQAGVKPAGNDRFIAAAEPNLQTGYFDHYDYWMNMRPSNDGRYWGNVLLNNPAVQPSRGQWMCVEHMVKLNNPVTDSNGEHAIWIDGVKVSHLGKGFPTGSWSGGTFTQNATGSPFEGFRWRNDSNLKLNWIWLQNYSPNDPAGFSGNILFDHVVAAKNRVGCLTPSSGNPDTTPPAISMSAPAAGATVSGSSVTISANATDNVGVSGVQFRMNGANLGSEDRTAPYSLSWDTTTMPDGSYALSATARDAAGNGTTSPAVTVTVSNGSASGVIFESNWDTSTGTSATAVTDGGRWPNYWEFNNGTSVQLLTVVPDGVNGHNALRVQQRGSTYAANLQIDDFMPQSRSYYLRFYMKNDDTSPANDHVVTVDTWEYWNMTFMRKVSSATGYVFDISMYGCGFTYPIGHWGPDVELARGAWYRFEYFVEFVDATHIRVHPRVYDASGTLVFSNADFRQQDYKAGGVWNGRDDWTLASYYAAGYTFCVEPEWTNDLGLGNNGAYAAVDTGLSWYFAGIQIRTDTWPGPLPVRSASAAAPVVPAPPSEAEDATAVTAASSRRERKEALDTTLAEIRWPQDGGGWAWSPMPVVRRDSRRRTTGRRS